MPRETMRLISVILTCQNSIDFRLVLLCLIDLDRAAIEEFIEKENIPFSLMTVRSKILNELKNAENLRNLLKEDL